MVRVFESHWEDVVKGLEQFYDKEELERLLTEYLEDPATFEEEAEGDPDRREFLDRLQKVVDASGEVQELQAQIEKLLRRYLSKVDRGERIFHLALSQKDNRKRESLAAELAQSDLPEKEKELFLNLARWINQPGSEGVRNILRTFGVDLEGNLSTKYHGEAPTLLRKIAALSLRLASHPDHLSVRGFVRGATLRTSPYDGEPINPRHRSKVEFIQQLYRSAPKKFDLGSKPLLGEDPNQTFWQGVIDTLLEWTDSYSTALRGGILYLKSLRRKGQAQWESKYLAYAEDLAEQYVQDMGEGALYDILSVLFAEALPWSEFFNPENVPAWKDILPGKGRFSSDWEELHPAERDQMRVWFFREVRHHLESRSRLGDLAMYIFSAYAWSADFHLGSTDLSSEFARIWKPWKEVKELMEETWSGAQEYARIIKRHLNNPRIRELLDDNDRRYLDMDLPPPTANKRHEDLVFALLQTALNAKERAFLNYWREHPYILSRTYIFTPSGIYPKNLIYFLRAAFGKGTQREWFQALKLLREVVESVWVKEVS